MVERRDATIALDQPLGGKNRRGVRFHAAAFLIHWSMATAAMMRTPIRR